MEPMAFRILHTADLHLGKSFSELPPERAGQRRADLLATLTRICRKARELKVDLLCVAGDLFDKAHPSPALLASARHALADAAVPVVVIPGNHDPLDEGSPYRQSGWPGNVHVAAQSGWQRLALDGPETWAFGYARGAAHQSPWPAFPGCAHDALLMLHAACLAPGLAADASYYPFTPNDIPPCAYLALGHHHRPLRVNAMPCAWYAGAPEPLEAEVTPAAVQLVTLTGTDAVVEPLDLATRHHRLATIAVDGLTAEEIWQRALAAANQDDLLTLRLTGLLDAGEMLDSLALAADLSSRCFAAEVDIAELHLPHAAAEGEGVLGALHALAQQRMQTVAGDERLRLERAVRYAALALEDKL
jgi:DNA repair exonuclease SbcCD nuclease subunit